MKGDRRGVADIQRIEAGRNRNPHQPVGLRQRGRTQAGAFRTQQQGSTGFLVDREIVDGDRLTIRGERHEFKPGPAHDFEIFWPAGQPQEGKLEHRPHRYPHGPAVVRIGTGRVEQDRVDTKRPGAPEDGSEVLRIVEAFQNDQRPGRLHDVVQGRLGQPLRRRNHPAMQFEPGHLVHDGRPDDEDRDVEGRQVIGELRVAGRGDEHTANRVGTGQQSPDHLETLGNEVAARPSQLRIGQVEVVANARIGRVVDLDHGGHVIIMPAGS